MGKSIPKRSSDVWALTDNTQEGAGGRQCLDSPAQRTTVTLECRACSAFPAPRALPTRTLAATPKPRGSWEETITNHKISGGLRLRILGPWSPTTLEPKRESNLCSRTGSITSKPWEHNQTAQSPSHPTSSLLEQSSRSPNCPLDQVHQGRIP